ncbi:MAG: sigma 54-interacting transcriptional regulator [Dethiobacter sp.]|jgi:transcriptional regulator with PAS, ATPase and Fis domain|nr:sigma 54-interacting transcriptional regulator [Dethiobacter sp.]
MNKAEIGNVLKQLNLTLFDEELMLTVLNHILDPIFAINEKCEIVFLNTSCQNVLQCGEDNKVIDEVFIENKNLCHDLHSEDRIRNIPFRINRNVVNFSVIPFWENGSFAGAIGIGKFKCIEEIYKLVQDFREKKSEQKVEIKFKPKRLLHKSMQKIIGNNVYFVKTLNKAAATAKTDSTVLIYGESGVGKQMIAEAIHESSNRASGPFIEVNCAAIPENLLESELFGYDSHSFTGASKKGKIGKFEAAQRGTIFLDEIAELSLSMQAKLLRVLQFKEFEKVGGTKVKTDTRVVAATNKSLDKMVQEGSFRDDLYYRLNVIPIFVKPLRERKDDLDILLDHFIEVLSERYSYNILRLSTELIVLLHSYSWPGNIRELENLIEYAYICARFDESQEIKIEHFPEYFLKSVRLKTDMTCTKVGKTMSEMIKKIEFDYILKTLQNTNFNKSEAIKLLGISRGSFYAKLKEYNIL